MCSVERLIKLYYFISGNSTCIAYCAGNFDFSISRNLSLFNFEMIQCKLCITQPIAKWIQWRSQSIRISTTENSCTRSITSRCISGTVFMIIKNRYLSGTSRNCYIQLTSRIKASIKNICYSFTCKWSRHPCLNNSCDIFYCPVHRKNSRSI